MGLYWNGIEITAGMVLEVEEYNYEVRNSSGGRARVLWKVLGLDSKQGAEAYYEPATGKKYSMKKVLRRRALAEKLRSGEVVQLPACSDFLVVEEFHDGKPAFKRCYSLDMLANIRSIRIVEGQQQ